MGMSAAQTSRLLTEHGLPWQGQTCSICGWENSGAWTEHIPGPKHYKKLQQVIGNGAIAQVRENLWQYWELTTQGIKTRIRFNHLDAELQTSEGAQAVVGGTPLDSGTIQN